MYSVSRHTDMEGGYWAYLRKEGRLVAIHSISEEEYDNDTGVELIDKYFHKYCKDDESYLEGITF